MRSSVTVDKKRKVLLVEDDPPVREALSEALASENYEIVSAANHGEALRGMAENHIDVALLDWHVGSENAEETLRQINALQPHLPIILMSAAPERISCAASGCALTLEKPLDLRLLFQKLAALC
jgi:DNA-binding response OmpR family regulator